MEKFIKEQPFEIVEHTHSYEISNENKQTKKFAGDTVFWAVKKK